MSTRLGLGTYRCADVCQAAAMAASQGADWVDTAPNYESGQAERSLATVLALYPDLHVSTKVGFVPDSAKRLGVQAGALSGEGAERGHCLAPAYVAWQVARSKRRLGRAPDLVFLHNPEHHCADKDIADRIWAAFLALEDACSNGTVSAYGVATWRGFSSGLFDVATLPELASKASARSTTFGPFNSPSHWSIWHPSRTHSTATVSWSTRSRRSWRSSPLPRCTAARFPAWLLGSCPN
ncbi:putative oxidoreductase [Kitasatospora sp. MAA4]|uniref:aldo/keto reductase n=1 Tax=Kitasatospora sp. MAA4 TaxID=3035093 RepID=UPI002473F992|nr:aldo/keto reductase [Kitasatospora sp. MAA4]MDH6133566.1 putative oxidoreductase [Kitasatospora sp. MAA4]